MEDAGGLVRLRFAGAAHAVVTSGDEPRRTGSQLYACERWIAAEEDRRQWHHDKLRRINTSTMVGDVKDVKVVSNAP